MITCDLLTTEKVKAELTLLEDAYKAERTRRVKKANAAAEYFGPKTRETRDAVAAKRELQEAYAPYRRHLQILLSVLESEADPHLQGLLEAVVEAHREKQADAKEGAGEP